jgi:hypothetical protein
MKAWNAKSGAQRSAMTGILNIFIQCLVVTHALLSPSSLSLYETFLSRDLCQDVSLAYINHSNENGLNRYSAAASLGHSQELQKPAP